MSQKCSRARWRWSPARRVARGAASPSSSGRPARTVSATGRTTRAQRSEYEPARDDRGDGRAGGARAGGRGIAVQVDHLDPAQVQALVARIEREQGRLDILVNDVWGGGLPDRVERARVGALAREAGCACCGSRSTRTSSPATSRCRS